VNEKTQARPAEQFLDDARKSYKTIRKGRKAYESIIDWCLHCADESEIERIVAKTTLQTANTIRYQEAIAEYFPKISKLRKKSLKPK